MVEKDKEKGGYWTLYKVPTGEIIFGCCSPPGPDDNYDVKLLEPVSQRSQSACCKGNIYNVE